MSRWELLDTARVPDGGELRLYRHRDEFSIRLPAYGELMSSRAHGSEDSLALLTCGEPPHPPGLSILIGGLGMGFTLAAALAAVGDDAKVHVAELVPEVVEWNRGDLGAVAGRPLDDPRVTVHVGDVADVLRQADGQFHGIAMDVDNGPEGFTRRANDWLYTHGGLMTAWRALRPGGVLTVWSAGPDRVFPARLRKLGFAVEEHRVRAHGKKGSRHIVWSARRS
jgi:spermidine synthase